MEKLEELKTDLDAMETRLGELRNYPKSRNWAEEEGIQSEISFVEGRISSLENEIAYITNGPSDDRDDPDRAYQSHFMR